MASVSFPTLFFVSSRCSLGLFLASRLSPSRRPSLFPCYCLCFHRPDVAQLAQPHANEITAPLFHRRTEIIGLVVGRRTIVSFLPRYNGARHARSGTRSRAHTRARTHALGDRASRGEIRRDTEREREVAGGRAADKLTQRGKSLTHQMETRICSSPVACKQPRVNVPVIRARAICRDLSAISLSTFPLPSRRGAARLDAPVSPSSRRVLATPYPSLGFAFLRFPVSVHTATLPSSL